MSGFMARKRVPGRHEETYLTYASKRKQSTPIELIRVIEERGV